MKIEKIVIHNFKSIKHQELNLGDYNVFVGENNSGKSNFISAIRYFFNEYDLKAADIFQKREDNSIYVEIHYSLSDKDIKFFSEEKGKKYLLPNNIVVVKTEAEISEEGISDPVRRGKLAETNDFDTDNKFFGFAGVSKALLGEVIYIPAIKELKDELKTTNQSTTIMKLLKKIVHPKLKDHSALNSINSGLSELNKTNVFEELNSGLSEMMKGYGCDIKIEIDPIKTEEVLSSASLKIIEENLDKMPPENKGTGLQRALLVNLIKFWAATDKKYKKLTQNEPPTILLFEEPEVFQHPQKQSMLFGELKQISTSNTPVFVTTHSTHFVSEEDKDLTFITRTHREKNFTQFKQITQETIDKAEKSGRFKFWKYLDSEKNKLFFADKVILCEGNTEKLISNYIIRNKIYKDDYINQSKFTVIDCVGKFNLPHFIRICNDLSISYMLFYDLDTDKQNFNSKHEPVNKEIEQEKSILCNITLTSSNDIESRLFKEKINNADKNLIIEKILNNEHIQHEFNLIQRSFESFLKISKK